MRCVKSGNEDELIERENLGQSLGNRQMPVVRRVERAAVKCDSLHLFAFVADIYAFFGSVSVDFV